jgi:hypothetical protein
MALKSKEACFRLGDFYRDMASGIEIARHELSESDFKKLAEAFRRIWDRAMMVQDEFFPRNLILTEIIKISGELWGEVKLLEEKRKRLRKEEARAIEQAINDLFELIEIDFYSFAQAECEA